MRSPGSSRSVKITAAHGQGGSSATAGPSSRCSTRPRRCAIRACVATLREDARRPSAGCAMSTRPVRIGCSGWQYRDWRGVLYPRGLRPGALARALRRGVRHRRGELDLLPAGARREAVARWVEQVPPGFVFALKASRYLIHMKQLRDIEERHRAVLRARSSRSSARRRSGRSCGSCRSGSRATTTGSARALDALPAGRHCFEFRHPSWFCDGGATSCCARTASRSRSATTPSGRGSRSC